MLQKKNHSRTAAAQGIAFSMNESSGACGRDREGYAFDVGMFLNDYSETYVDEWPSWTDISADKGIKTEKGKIKKYIRKTKSSCVGIDTEIPDMVDDIFARDIESSHEDFKKLLHAFDQELHSFDQKDKGEQSFRGMDFLTNNNMLMISEHISLHISRSKNTVDIVSTLADNILDGRSKLSILPTSLLKYPDSRDSLDIKTWESFFLMWLKKNGLYDGREELWESTSFLISNQALPNSRDNLRLHIISWMIYYRFQEVIDDFKKKTNYSILNIGDEQIPNGASNPEMFISNNLSILNRTNISHALNRDFKRFAWKCCFDFTDSNIVKMSYPTFKSRWAAIWTLINIIALRRNIFSNFAAGYISKRVFAVFVSKRHAPLSSCLSIWLSTTHAFQAVSLIANPGIVFGPNPESLKNVYDSMRRIASQLTA